MLTRLRNRAGAVVLMAFVMAMAAVPAFATTVEGEITSALGDLRTTVLGVITAFFALAIVGVGIRVGLKYVKRGASAA
jgi:hypothetical protein